MTRPLRAVKREIRILGLDFCNTHVVTGAVCRGGQFLDGVFTFHTDGKPDSRDVAARILRTRYYPELRAIMVHDPKNRSRKGTIARTVGLPIIEVFTARPGKPGFSLHTSPRGRLWIRTSLPVETVNRIVSVTWTFGRLPEPARIAHLLAQTRITRPLLNDKE